MSSRFLWYVLADLPNARKTVEAEIRTEPRVFWFSALLIQLLHLEFGIPDEFRPADVQTKERLILRVLDG